MTTLNAPVAPAPVERPAGFWIRFVASLIDGVILTAAYIPIMIVWGAAFGTESAGGSDRGEMPAGLTLILLVVGLAYFILMEASAMRATIGKLAVGVRVGDEHGNRLSVARATGRTLGKIVSGFILYIGYIMAAFTDRKQALHDMMAATYVTRSR